MTKLNSMPKIKPCPFCGKKRCEWIWDDFVQCPDCRASGPERKTERGAIVAWNKAARLHEADHVALTMAERVRRLAGQRDARRSERRVDDDVVTRARDFIDAHGPGQAAEIMDNLLSLAVSDAELAGNRAGVMYRDALSQINDIVEAVRRDGGLEEV